MTSLCVSFMKYLLIGLLASATMFATQSRQTFSGTITDEECPSADHSGMRMGSTDAACTIACVDDHSVQFVLFDGKATCRSRIRHQAAAGSWTMARQWEIQRTWLNSARAAVRSPAKPNGV